MVNSFQKEIVERVINERFRDLQNDAASVFYAAEGMIEELTGESPTTTQKLALDALRTQWRAWVDKVDKVRMTFRDEALKRLEAEQEKPKKKPRSSKKET